MATSTQKALVLVLFAQVFLLITSIHLEFAMIRAIHLELILLVVSVALYLVNDNNPLEQGLFLLCALIIGAPLISDLSNAATLSVLHRPEYRSWIKGLLLAGMLYYTIREEKESERLIDVILFSLVVFSGIVLYRFYVLGEAREFDLRPSLHTKNGDPNFICTFFAVGIPLALWRAQKNVLFVGLAVYFGFIAVISESRMGLISIAVSLVYLLWKSGWNLAMRLGVLALLGAIGIGAYRFGRFNALADASNVGRLKSFVNGFTMFTQKPWTGFGWDTSSQHYFENVGYPRFAEEALPLSVHNTPLQLLADLGLYGLLWYGLLIAIVVRALVTRKQNPYSVACFLAFLFNFFTLPLATKDFAFLFLLLPILLDPPTQKIATFE